MLSAVSHGHHWGTSQLLFEQHSDWNENGVKGKWLLKTVKSELFAMLGFPQQAVRDTKSTVNWRAGERASPDSRLHRLPTPRFHRPRRRESSVSVLGP